jgi:hypothetical protein
MPNPTDRDGEQVASGARRNPGSCKIEKGDRDRSAPLCLASPDSAEPVLSAAEGSKGCIRARVLRICRKIRFPFMPYRVLALRGGEAGCGSIV